MRDAVVFKGGTSLSKVFGVINGIPVATVIAMVADGMTTAEILQAYPDLEAEDIHEALHFAADAVRERELPLLSS